MAGGTPYDKLKATLKRLGLEHLLQPLKEALERLTPGDLNRGYEDAERGANKLSEGQVDLIQKQRHTEGIKSLLQSAVAAKQQEWAATGDPDAKSTLLKGLYELKALIERLG